MSKIDLIRCPFCGNVKPLKGDPECSCGNAIFEPGDLYANSDNAGAVFEVDLNEIDRLTRENAELREKLGGGR